MADGTDAPSPAERFQAAAERGRFPQLTAFAAAQPFQLDDFQRRACRAYEQGSNVLVCAPTGAGKTLVGEFAAAVALRRGGRMFYTTPIKALSNQKFREFAAQFGQDAVGLLTGDTRINAHAPVVVMTTEVLRNMLYSSAAGHGALEAVVLDEVHYLGDRFRGAVWEEVILQLPQAVRIVGLSATVSNAEELGSWIRSVRGETAVIVDETRPVPLWQHLLVGSKVLDLYAEREMTQDADLATARAVNPHVLRAISRIEAETGPDRRGRRQSSARRHEPRDGFRWRPAPRPLVAERLDAAGLLPAIVFIFSRAGCDAAVDQFVRSGLDLVTEEERHRIAEIIRAHTETVPAVDLAALELPRWSAAWLRGVAAHHAGLLPAFKEAVEDMFAAGLVKVVYATETLALGINMPARTVVLERLVKFDGENHAEITPGEYTQLTGRAGRRGIDVEGHAVVTWSPHMDVSAVAGLASRRTFTLRSSFRPTYNMAINLVDRMGFDAASSLLSQSFAQFQANRAVAGKERQLASLRAERTALQATVDCDKGDVREYLRLVTAAAAADKKAARERSARRGIDKAADLRALRPGDIIRIDRGKRAGLAVVLDSRPGPSGDVRPLVATEHRWAGRVVAADFRNRIPVLGRLRLGRGTNHADAKVRADLAAALRSSSASSARHVAGVPDDWGSADAAEVRAAVRRHPVHACAERDDHLTALRRQQRLDATLTSWEGEVTAAHGSMTSALRSLCAVLQERGYLDGESATDAGRQLGRIWLEVDLLAAETLSSGAWSELSADHLAGVVSGLVYEGRGGSATTAATLPEPIRGPARTLEDRWREVRAVELAHGLPPTRRPDFGFAEATAAWVRGTGFADCLNIMATTGVDMPPGDFVRWCRQVIDALDQLRQAAGRSAIPQAGAAIAALSRGVVTAGIR